MQFQRVYFKNKIFEYNDVYSYLFIKDNISYLAGQYSHILIGLVHLLDSLFNSLFD